MTAGAGLGVALASQISDARQVFRWLDGARGGRSLVIPPEISGSALTLVRAYERSRRVPISVAAMTAQNVDRVLAVRFRGGELPEWPAGIDVESHDLQWSREVFVYGSNLQGRNGKGAALTAKTDWGAKPLGEGRQYQCYAIPTKETPYRILPLDKIAAAVGRFTDHARSEPDHHFLLTAIGTGQSGYSPVQIAPLFSKAPPNVSLIDDQGRVRCRAQDWSRALLPAQETIRTSLSEFAAK